MLDYYLQFDWCFIIDEIDNEKIIARSHILSVVLQKTSNN